MSPSSDHQDTHIPKSKDTVSRPATPRLKLRDSCHACAQSKVKCHKQKPSCSRCIRKGLTCEYFHSKRPGRKRDSQQITSGTVNNDTVPVEETSPVARESHEIDTAEFSNLSVFPDYLFSLDTPSMSHKPCTTSASGVLQAITSPSDLFLHDFPHSPDLQLPNSMGFGSNFDDFLNSPLDLLDVEPTHTNTSQFHHGTDISELLLPSKEDLLPISGPHLGSQDGNVKLWNSQEMSSQHDQCISNSTSPQCSCLLQALNLLKQLSSSQSTSTQCVSTPIPDTPVSCTFTEPILLENRQAMDAVSKMVACPCADDAYLLTILTMIVFKILAQFASAAGIHNQHKMDGGDEENYAARLAAQSVLGEMHRVQRLANMLSPRFQSPKTRAGTDGRPFGHDTGEQNYQGTLYEVGMGNSMSFPVAILGVAETGLRKAISTLSGRIIHVLRQT
jgi:hypothetical protein